MVSHISHGIYARGLYGCFSARSAFPVVQLAQLGQEEERIRHVQRYEGKSVEVPTDNCSLL